MSLVQLPDEIILTILSYTTPTDHLSLAQVSRQLKRCTTHCIYNSIVFIDKLSLAKHERECNRRGKAEKHRGCGTINFFPTCATFIYDIQRFLDTIVESKALCSYICAASFTINADLPTNDCFTIINILNLIQPTLQSLHLAPATHGQSLVAYKMITSLKISSIDLDYDYVNGRVDQSLLYSAIKSPSLKLLVFDQARSWCCFSGNTDIELAGTLEVEHFYFTNSVSAGYDLNELLSWPRNLKTFYLEAYPEYARYGNHTMPLSALTFTKALWLQRASLENIFITGQPDNKSMDSETMGSLREFVCVRKLGLLREFLVLDQDTLAIGDEDEIETPRNILGLLPPNLTDLQIELDDEFGFPQYFEAEAPQYMREEPGEFSGWLCEIARHKQTQYPQLSNLIVWVDSGYGDNFYEWDPNDSEGCSEAVSAMSQSGIRLRFITSGKSPLQI